MSTYRNLIQAAKTILVSKAQHISVTRSGIRKMAFKAPRPQFSKDSGVPVSAQRSARKAVRCPETGPQRAKLKQELRTDSFDARLTHLLYGFLRGKPYSSLEKANTREVLAPRTLLYAFQTLALHALYNEEMPTEKDFQEWLAGTGWALSLEKPSRLGKAAELWRPNSTWSAVTT